MPSNPLSSFPRRRKSSRLKTAAGFVRFAGMALAVLLLPFTAYAAATDKLKTFIAATHSAQSDFTQEVLDKNGKRIQFASGTMQFVRPGKFRWEYRTPYEQLIVGDGKKFWLYD
ncbi:MAG: outer membrane lipoprotein chaperone LolA, partial [Sideroxydans sp.]